MLLRLSARNVRFGLGLTVVLLAGAGLGRPLLVAAQQAAEPQRSEAPAVEIEASLPRFERTGPTAVVRRVSRLHTEILDRGRLGLLIYQVQRGDTASSIAERFGLTAETILWGNEGLSTEAGNLQVGLELNILPLDGVLHTVREGETLESLEAMYDVPAEAIVELPANGLAGAETTSLVAGQMLVVPGATKEVAWLEPGPPVLAGLGRRSPGFYSGALVYVGTGYFQWPVSPIRITQGYSSGHPAIDLDTYAGQPVFAADSGTVIFSGWDATGYGNLIIVDHGNGLWTYYAHNQANLVRAGDGVLQGGQIAESGSSGNSTGEHLDFRIRLAEGGFLNPLDYLP